MDNKTRTQIQERITEIEQGGYVTPSPGDACLSPDAYSTESTYIEIVEELIGIIKTLL